MASSSRGGLYLIRQPPIDDLIAEWQQGPAGAAPSAAEGVRECQQRMLRDGVAEYLVYYVLTNNAARDAGPRAGATRDALELLERIFTSDTARAEGRDRIAAANPIPALLAAIARQPDDSGLAQAGVSLLAELCEALPAQADLALAHGAAAFCARLAGEHQRPRTQGVREAAPHCPPAPATYNPSLNKSPRRFSQFPHTVAPPSPRLSPPARPA